MTGNLKSVLAWLARMDYGKTKEKISSGIRKLFTWSGREKAIIGVSGGVDSAVALKLCVDALGPGAVMGLVMPTKHTPNGDLTDAEALLKKLDCEYELFSLDKIVDAMASCWSMKPDKMVLGNLTARLRMAHLFAHANSLNGLVIGTGDKSEISIGYFTKYGDGACDLLPIGALLKTQVRGLGKHLGLPDGIVSKPSSPALWGDHSAEKELGMRYDKVDACLWLMESGAKDSEIVEIVGKNELKKIKELVKWAKHKTELPPVMPIE